MYVPCGSRSHNACRHVSSTSSLTIVVKLVNQLTQLLTTLAVVFSSKECKYISAKCFYLFSFVYFRRSRQYTNQYKSRRAIVFSRCSVKKKFGIKIYMNFVKDATLMRPVNDTNSRWSNMDAGKHTTLQMTIFLHHIPVSNVCWSTPLTRFK